MCQYVNESVRRIGTGSRGGELETKLEGYANSNTARTKLLGTLLEKIFFRDLKIQGSQFF